MYCIFFHYLKKCFFLKSKLQKHYVNAIYVIDCDSVLSFQESLAQTQRNDWWSTS